MTDQRPRPSIAIGTINMDCRDPQAMANFYTRLLGWEVTLRDHDFILLENPDGGTGISFQAESWFKPPIWPERSGELAKMIHLDLKVDDLAAATEHAIACGARLADHQPRADLRVLLDPAGHPFCLGTD